MAVPENGGPAAGIRKVNIGTRKSQLAIAQVESTIEQLKAHAPETEYVSRVVSTMADENQTKQFSAFDSKSIWTEELEQLLMDGKLDVVVHCLKGMFRRFYNVATRRFVEGDQMLTANHRHANFTSCFLLAWRDLRERRSSRCGRDEARFRLQADPRLAAGLSRRHFVRKKKGSDSSPLPTSQVRGRTGKPQHKTAKAGR